MKTCNICGQTLPLDQFNKSHSGNADGYFSFCKKCKNEKLKDFRARTANIHTKKYEKTKKGFLVRVYRNMKSRITGVQKAKSHLYVGKDLLPKEEFYTWALANPDFHSLFTQYEQSAFNRQLAPSVDRIDSTRGYSLDNMHFITHHENSLRAIIGRKKIIKGKVM